MTVDLEVDRAAVPPAPAHGNPAVEAWYDAPHAAGVMVCTADGYLSLLEVYSVSDEPVTVWPDPSFIRR
ncbi:hypothetical protein [Streptomyces sp. NPDC002328]|uniref:hypothetical protein n=1 Tax=Streptomyces sp. NPDC002328 TaxID=3364642 RepID=UPI00369E9D68